MSSVREETVKSILTVEGKQAISELGKLQMESKELRTEYNRIKAEQAQWIKESKNLATLEVSLAKILDRQKELRKEGKENSKEYAALDKKYEKLIDKIDQARKATEKLRKSEEELANTNKKLDDNTKSIEGLRKKMGLTSMTLRELINHSKDLKKQLYNTATFGTEAWTDLQKQIQEVDGAIISQRMLLKNQDGSIGGSAFFKGLKRELLELAPAAGIMVGLAGAIETLRKTISVSSEFEQSISNLSAITGATGEQLQMLEDAARRIGATTTLSAQQTADAFTIIASKKPELLSNNEALIATTESAIMLAEAAGIELPEAADALTNTLNQFAAGSDQADRFVNVLAAGARFGAGEIDYLNDAVKRFGPIANEMNISFEESVAMMEVFAEKGLESEKAGTQFRNILIKLAAGAKETNPAIVGMDEAIANLGKQQLNTAELAKMFGSENLVAAQIMINSAARFSELTTQVTGTSSALEQARTRVDNFKGDMKSLQSITEDYMIVIGGFITDALRPLVQGFTAMLVALRETPKFIKENKDLFIALGIALVTFNATQITATALMLKDIAVKKAHAIWTGAVTTATNLLNAAMTANPIGLVIKAVGLLTAGFVILYNRSQAVRGAISGIGEVALTIWEIIKETFGKFTEAWAAFKDGDIAKGFKTMGELIVKTNPIGLAMTEGKRLAEAFKKGYQDKIAEELAVAGLESTGPGTVPTVDPGNLDDDNADDYTGAVEKLVRTTAEAIKSPDRKNPLKDVELHFDKMKAIHEKFGLDIAEQEKARDAVRAANAEKFRQQELENEQKLADAKLFLAQQLGNGLGAMIDLIGSKQGELTGFQKALALAQIAIDTAAALGKVLPLALNTSAKDGPLAAFTLAGYIASMTASVLSGAARAKQMLSQADVPEYGGNNQNKPQRRRDTTQRKSFYFGGATSDGLGFGDQYGEFAGYVHRNEYVVPQIVTSDPWVANLLPAIEAIRKDRIKGFASGGATTPMPTANPAGMSTARMESLMLEMLREMKDQKKSLRAYLVYNDLEEMKEEMDTLKNRFKA